MSFLKTAWADLKYGVTHPATIKKAIAAFAATVVTDSGLLLAFGVFLPPSATAVLVTIHGVAVSIVTFLAPNAPKTPVAGSKPQLVK